jgi:HEAT repeat protein
MKIVALSALLLSTSIFASAPQWKPKYRSMEVSKKANEVETAKQVETNIKGIEKLFTSKSRDKAELKRLKELTLKMGNKAVPTLIKVMKSDKYPEYKRWTATFLLGRIMGDKSAAFIAKFTKHPNWMMRLASLKTLTAMKNTTYLRVYADLLSDEAFIVRSQALESVRSLKLSKLAPSVWKMLYDKRNYSETSGNNKRNDIIKKVITTIGDLKFKDAQMPLLKMVSNRKFNDIFEELDYSLTKLSGKKSPKGGLSKKRHFWKRIQLAKTTI